MKIDWQTVIATLVAMTIFAVLNKMFLSKLTDKIGGNLEMFESLENDLED